MVEIMYEVIKSTMVKPAEPTPWRSMRLSLLDRMNNFPHHNSNVQIYKPSGVGEASSCSAEEFFDAAALRKSLGKVLVHFYPVAGRYRLGEDGQVEIDCNEEGVLFVEAESSSTIADLGDFVPSPEFRTLVPSVDYSGEISSFPLMIVQITYFKCGGVSLGIGIEHHSVDGPSAFHLINSWAEIARGLDISVPPVHDRTLLRARDPPQPKFDHLEYKYAASAEQISNQNTIKVVVFKITKDLINRMKDKAKQIDQKTNYSTFEVLAAHTWRCVCKARKVACDQEIRLSFPVNGRFNRLKPQLPLGFFGNAHFRTVVILNAGDLQSKPLSYAASKIHETVVRMDDEYLRSAIDYLELQPDLSVVRTSSHVYASPNFHITSWVRLGPNHADFGWGPPVYSGPGGIKFEKAYIFTCGDNGNLSLAIALQADTMEVFEKLFYEFV